MEHEDQERRQKKEDEIGQEEKVESEQSARDARREGVRECGEGLQRKRRRKPGPEKRGGKGYGIDSRGNDDSKRKFKGGGIATGGHNNQEGDRKSSICDPTRGKSPS